MAATISIWPARMVVAQLNILATAADEKRKSGATRFRAGAV